MLGFTRGGVGYVIVKTTSLHDASTGYKGLDGKEIMSDVTYDPQRHARTYGEVVQLPVEMGMAPIYSVPPGSPGYGPIRRYLDHDMDDVAHPALYSRPKFGYKFMNDIEPELKLGDKVYFSWRIAYSKNNILAMSNDPNPEDRIYLLKVPYNEVYCAVRDGEIIPIASNVFIDPEVETWEDVLTPTYYKQLGPDGKPVARPKEEWIQTKRFPENKDRLGTIMHIGTPIKGEKADLKVGDRVIYKVKMKNTKTIEGKKFMVIPQRKILLKIKAK